MSHNSSVPGAIPGRQRERRKARKDSTASTTSTASQSEMRLIGGLLENFPEDPLVSEVLQQRQTQTQVNRQGAQEFVPEALLERMKLAEELKRPFSAPPQLSAADETVVMKTQEGTFSINGRTISEDDPRLSPEYYTYYYQQRPLDPRLPPPLFNWSSWHYANASRSGARTTPATAAAAAAMEAHAASTAAVSNSAGHSPPSSADSFDAYSMRKNPDASSNKSSPVRNNDHGLSANEAPPSGPSATTALEQAQLAARQAHLAQANQLEQQQQLLRQQQSTGRGGRGGGKRGVISNGQSLSPGYAGMSLNHAQEGLGSDDYIQQHQLQNNQVLQQNFNTSLRYQQPMTGSSPMMAVMGYGAPPRNTTAPQQYVGGRGAGSLQNSSAMESQQQSPYTGSSWPSGASSSAGQGSVAGGYVPSSYQPFGNKQPAQGSSAGVGAGRGSVIESRMGGASAVPGAVRSKNANGMVGSGRRSMGGSGRGFSEEEELIGGRTGGMGNGGAVGGNEHASGWTQQRGSGYGYAGLRQEENTEDMAGLGRGMERLSMGSGGNDRMAVGSSGRSSNAAGGAGAGGAAGKQTLKEMIASQSLLELSMDQYGSRFIQTRIKSASPEDRNAALVQLLPHTMALCMDVFGNYVIQKFIEFGNMQQREALCQEMRGHVFELSVHMYGCRVVQKALDDCDVESKVQFVRELENHVLQCIKDQNGNHVIQKCIQRVPNYLLQGITEATARQVQSLAAHPYGCRVIQRLLEHCSEEQRSSILEEVVAHAEKLCRNQYGNYVVQHVLQLGSPENKSSIIQTIRGKCLELSRHKFASNVIEKCFANASPQDREMLLQEVIGPLHPADGQMVQVALLKSPLLLMVKDQYANYVVQRILDVAEEPYRREVVDRIRRSMPTLQKIPYCRQILSRVESMTADMQQQDGRGGGGPLVKGNAVPVQMSAADLGRSHSHLQGQAGQHAMAGGSRLGYSAMMGTAVVHGRGTEPSEEAGYLYASGQT
eukprot:g28908.t1